MHSQFYIFCGILIIDKLKKLNKDIQFLEGFHEKNKWKILLILSIALLVLTACFNKKEDIDKKESEKQLSEEELQKGKGVNGDLPDIVYTYEGIVDAAPGIYQFPDTYEENIVKKSDIWREYMK